MAASTISNVRIAGLANAVPRNARPTDADAALFGVDGAKVVANSGVVQRSLAGSLCASDLCFAAARRLLTGLDWAPDTIDAIIFVSQTPDYILPATSCSLHGRLGLSKDCAAFDVNLGCSGYVYGLWTASLLIAGGNLRRVLLLAGDTISRISAPRDRSVALLFGDAGSATALERDDAAAPLMFVLGTDGAGERALIVPAGGFRTPRTPETAVRTERENGNIRSDEDLYMNGAEIFTFTLRELPPLIQSVLSAAGWGLDAVDSFVFHQANLFMLQHLAKRMRIPLEKLALALSEYGNTSCASIPLAMDHCLRDTLRTRDSKLVLAGFGVGFSWAAVACRLGPCVIPELTYVDLDVPTAA